MTNRFQPISAKCPHLLHGADYNPDQWLRTPEIWDEDMRLMHLAGCNAMSVGIFAWSALEPREGQFNMASWFYKTQNEHDLSGIPDKHCRERCCSQNGLIPSQ